ncbi:hypothetical protein [Lactococcus cremoris]|uniref:hypothetical protein n=1 Tax=Lactococcus lactis subsp. cremoris TaxID=1359 RepID=UPI0009C2FE6D|nr:MULTISPECIES: hypothetical protein [Lactococcus]QGJ84445.1 hypothetical protein [Lactococcus phage proPhi1]QGJ84605.1 hypothetical protein [Lactococcus phage proPhi5]AXN65091.1 phage-encoded protein [Lactococcus cremoris]MRM51613.1 hypothetical protein [Lactococcus cremoris]QTB96804.1 hypothetical protein J3S98_10050 [Lactococcus cremoris]
MSELEKTAQQIAAEALNFKSKAYYTIEQQNETIAANRKAFMKILSISSLTIPKSIADELEEEIEEAYSSDYIRSYSDVGACMEVITDGLDEESELYKFMFPDDALLGCSHRNIIYLYLVDNDLVKVGEG